ncbi:MAG: hypothetical protein IMZ71_01855 [Chloroflexi bacterium]|nr:hypothetical protein [Chloroflexota bacterium]
MTQNRYGGAAEYRGGIVELNLRGARMGFDGSLTVSSAYSTPSGAPNEPRLGIMADWGHVTESPTVRGVVSGWYQVTSAAQLSGAFRARTGMAVDPRAAGLDLNGDAVFGDRTPTLAPFSFRLPATNAVDLRFSYSVPWRKMKFSFYVESFNVLNRKDIRTVLNDYGRDPLTPKSRWLEPSTYFPPREVQLGLRVAF